MDSIKTETLRHVSCARNVGTRGFDASSDLLKPEKVKDMRSEIMKMCRDDAVFMELPRKNRY